jgi:hypothetical protein
MARKLSPAMETHLLNLRAGRVYGGGFDGNYILDVLKSDSYFSR